MGKSLRDRASERGESSRKANRCGQSTRMLTLQVKNDNFRHMRVTKILVLEHADVDETNDLSNISLAPEGPCVDHLVPMSISLVRLI